MREDYSHDGNAWDYFTHDQARSRVYRWGEDGLAGRRVSANVALLGQLLQHYGPEAKGVQESLQLAVERVLAKNWPNERAENWKPSPKAGHIPEVYDQLRALAPKDEEHRMMQSENPRSASEYSAAALADYCTKRRNDIAADTIRDDFLGDEYFRQLGPVFTRERDVSNDLLCSCVVRVWCNFFGP